MGAADRRHARRPAGRPYELPAEDPGQQRHRRAASREIQVAAHDDPADSRTVRRAVRAGMARRAQAIEDAGGCWCRMAAAAGRWADLFALTRQYVTPEIGRAIFYGTRQAVKELKASARSAAEAAQAQPATPVENAAPAAERSPHRSHLPHLSRSRARSRSAQCRAGTLDALRRQMQQRSRA